MKAIVIDYLRRWKWVLIITGVFQLFMVVALSGEQSNFALFTVIYTGAMLLSFDLARGTPRVCLALPVTRSELAWSWRFVTIVVPICIFTANLVLGNLLKGVVFSSFERIVPLSQGTFWIFFALLWLGVSFHLLVHFPSPAMAQDPANKMKNNLIGGLWGLTLGGGFLVVMKMPKDWGELELWHWMLLAAALVSTVFGWQAADELVVNRAGPARASEDFAKRSGRQEKEAKGTKGDGLSFLFRTMVAATLRALAVFMTVCIGIQIFTRGGRQETWLETGIRVVQDPITFYILVPLVLITGLQWVMGIRHLRTLPIRASRLTLLVCGLFVVPTLFAVTAVGLLQLSLGAERISLEWVSRVALMTTPMLLAPGLLLRLGLTWKSYFLVIMPLFAAAPMATLLVQYLTVPMRGLICVVAWTLGAFLTHRSITRRSETYRHTLTWPMMQQAS